MKKYAICGVSQRASYMFIEPIVNEFKSNCEIVAFLDPDPKRFEVIKKTVPELKDVPTFDEHQFDEMVEQTKPDVIFATGRDCTHIIYILKALKKDLDVIAEKPMVTTSEDCRKVLETEKKSKGKVSVTFNMRYMPVMQKIKGMIKSNRIGRITHVDFNYYLNPQHGASYFKRWHRQRENSGGLTIHKSTHHLDCATWLIDQKPEQVFAYGALNYYGPEGSMNPKKVDGRFCATCKDVEKCPYQMRLVNRVMLSEAAKLKSAADEYTDYRQDSCLFDSEINIEDTYVISARFDKGTMLSYTLNFSLPYEGYRLAINGTNGRIETNHSYKEPEAGGQTIRVMPLFDDWETVFVEEVKGEHGGADPRLREDLFLGEDPSKPFKTSSGAMDGALSVAMGEAAWKSAKENRVVTISELLG